MSDDNVPVPLEINTPVTTRWRRWRELSAARKGRFFISEEEGAKRLTWVVLEYHTKRGTSAQNDPLFFIPNHPVGGQEDPNVFNRFAAKMGLVSEVSIASLVRPSFDAAGRIPHIPKEQMVARFCVDSFNLARAHGWILPNKITRTVGGHRRTEVSETHIVLSESGLETAAEYKVWCERKTPKATADWLEDHKGLMAGAAALFTFISLLILVWRFVVPHDPELLDINWPPANLEVSAPALAKAAEKAVDAAGSASASASASQQSATTSDAAAATATQAAADAQAAAKSAQKAVADLLAAQKAAKATSSPAAQPNLEKSTD